MANPVHAPRYTAGRKKRQGSDGPVEQEEGIAMKYREDGFRSFNNVFVTVPVTDKLRKLIQTFPGGAEADYILAYGYIDHEAGMTLEVLAAAQKAGKGFRFWDSNDEGTVKIRIGSITDLECYYLDDDDGKLYGWYKEKVDNLSVYDVDDDVKVSRGMEFLDAFREPDFPDDVLVHLFKEGYHAEGCWVRVEALDEENHQFLGTLLNEPEQELGCHEGDRIAFFFYEAEKDRRLLCADLDQEGAIVPAPRAHMQSLEEAIRAFYDEGSQENLHRVFETLTCSTVLIPCEAKLSDADMAQFMKLLETKGEDLTGDTVISQDNVRLIPKILQHEGKSFFSTEEAMEDYGKECSIVVKPFMEVLPLVQHHPEKLSGIVVNPFTQPFVVPMELLEREKEE